MLAYQGHKKEFISSVNLISRVHGIHTVFSDFCKMFAISLYQPMAKDEKLEKEYLSIISKYSKEEQNIFPQMGGHVILALKDAFGDFLGECYMALEIGNKHTGQFFTPYSISKLLSALVGGVNGNFCNVMEPAVGSGGMIIAKAEELSAKGIDYSEVMNVQAVDIDITCFYMSFIHFAVLGIPAEVVWGNSLSLEVHTRWFTPAYVMREMKKAEEEKNIEKREVA